jgi:DNA-binding transcriptional ArsR family regulator
MIGWIMKKAKVDLILHPVRMRIVMALVGKKLSAQELSETLKDVPQATLYRHINRLADAGLIEIVEERPVRGTLEKVYTLDTRKSHLGPEEVANLSKEDHLRYFMAFVATLLDDFSRYIHQSEEIDLVADGVGYQKFPLTLSDEEFKQMNQALNEALKPFFEKESAPGRRRRLFTFTVMPDMDEPQESGTGLL